MSIIKNIINNVRDLKDSGISSLAKKFIDSKIEEYGHLVNFQIDSKKRNIILDIWLKGEKEDIKVIVESYEIVYNNSSAYLRFKKVSASREWIEILIKKFVLPKYAPQNMFKIDSSLAKIINFLI